MEPAAPSHLRASLATSTSSPPPFTSYCLASYRSTLSSFPPSYFIQGCVTFFQEYLDRAVSFTESQLDGADLVARVAQSLTKKFQDRIKVVKSLQAIIEAQYNSFPASNTADECCYVALKEYDTRFKNNTNLDQVCTSGEKTDQATKFVSNDVKERMKKNLKDYPSIKWQFFGSEEGVMTTYPSFRHCDSAYDPRFR